MRIWVVCPHCQERYQLEQSLAGKRMRCPNNLCREVFEVREEGKAVPPSEAPAPPEQSPTKAAGTVDKLLPMLRAEPLAPPAPQPSAKERVARPGRPAAERLPLPPKEPVPAPPVHEAAWERFAPPLRRGNTVEAAVPPLAEPDADVEVMAFGPEAWAAPPVRDTAQTEAGPEAAAPEAAELSVAAAKVRRRSRRILLALLVLLAGGAGMT